MKLDVDTIIVEIVRDLTHDQWLSPAFEWILLCLQLQDNIATIWMDEGTSLSASGGLLCFVSLFCVCLVLGMWSLRWRSLERRAVTRKTPAPT